MSSDNLENNLAAELKAINPKRIFIAYSGGVDSSVLLHGVHQLKLDVPVFAIHIHHGLSQYADDWLKHCQLNCDALGIELLAHKVTLNLPVNAQVSVQANKKGKVSGIEKAAREARYNVFEHHLNAGDVLLMGHHQDDQIETFMIRLMRGSGLTGLTAMDKTRVLGNGQLSRPLLNTSRLQIEAYAAQHKINFINDDSNTNTDFDRNWWRLSLLPLIQDRFSQSSQSILKTIEILQDEHQLLNDLLEPVYQTVVEPQGCLINQKLSEQSLSIQCQIIRKWLEQHGLYPLLAHKQIQTLVSDVLNARLDAEPVFMWQGNEIRRHNGKLYCMKRLPIIERSTFPLAFNGTSLPRLPLGELEQRVGLGLKPGQYQLALYEGSAKAKPISRPNKSLKKWFQEYSIPPWQRPYWPILFKDGLVVAVPGLFVCQGYACEQGWQLNFKL